VGEGGRGWARVDEEGVADRECIISFISSAPPVIKPKLAAAAATQRSQGMSGISRRQTSESQPASGRGTERGNRVAIYLFIIYKSESWRV
jgi:hypothetical protein